MSETPAEATYETRRKDRRDSLTGQVKQGPTHAIHLAGQSWCGRQFRGLSIWRKDQPLSAVDCEDCKKSIEKSQPRSWRR